MSGRRLRLGAVAAGLVTMVTLVAIPGAGAASSSNAQAGSSTSVVVRAGAKQIGHSFKQSGSGLLSLRSSQATGAVMPTPVVYLVFWGSQWSDTTKPAQAAAESALQGLFGQLYGTADTWGTILNQYCENMPVGTTQCASGATYIQHPASSLLGGVWFDKTSPAPSKATTSQIAAEAVSAAKNFGNTTPTKNLNSQYVIASPSGTHPDGFPHGFCGWHSSTSSSTYGNIAYTNLPFVPDLPLTSCTTLTDPQTVDGYLSTETHEYAESVTDPFPSNGWLKGGAEIGDLCVNLDAYLSLGGVNYDVQGLWSNLDDKCVTTGP